jgi:lipopolysaccharide biosynthesis regulator YciM
MKSATFFSRTIAILGALAFGIALSAKEPFFEGLGYYARKVTTDSAEAQRYFNQGLAFLHVFNHGAAIRSFQEAARLDSTCAMAHWALGSRSGMRTTH